MVWHKLEIACRKDSTYLIEEILIAFNAISTSIFDDQSNPIYEPNINENPLWDYTRIDALFDKTISQKDIETLLIGLSYSNLKICVIQDQNWVELFQKNIKSRLVGKKLWIVPSWEKININQSEKKIIIDPGMAFGSGTHETTQLCLEYIESCEILENKTVIDFGCGSGILGITSAIFGAKKVLCYDRDIQAKHSTLENAAQNQVSGKIIFSEPEEIISNSVDIIFANIISNTILDLYEIFLKWLKPEGRIVLSGVLENQFEDVNKKYSHGFELLRMNTKERWILLEYSKRFNK